MKTKLLSLFAFVGIILFDSSAFAQKEFKWGTASWNIQDGTVYENIESLEKEGIKLSFTNPNNYSLTFYHMLVVSYDLFVDGAETPVQTAASSESGQGLVVNFDYPFVEGHSYKIVTTESRLVKANIATYTTDTISIDNTTSYNISFTVNGPELVKTIDVEAYMSLSIVNPDYQPTYSFIDTNEICTALGINEIGEAKFIGLNANGSYNKAFTREDYGYDYYSGWRDADGDYTNWWGSDGQLYRDLIGHKPYPAVYSIQFTEKYDTVVYLFYDYWIEYDPNDSTVVSGKGAGVKRNAPETHNHEMIWDWDNGDGTVTQYLRRYRCDEGSDYKASFVFLANKKYVLINAILHFVSQEEYPQRQIAVATFEDFTIESESHWCGGEPDEDTGLYIGGFTNGSFYFNTGAMPDYDYWYFFGYANSTATKYESLADQWNNCLGGGYKSANYGVAYAAAFNGPCEVKVLANNGEGAVVPGFMITNSAYALSSMMNGDASAKKFTEDDWFKLTITGYKGEEETGTVDFYLAKDGKFVTYWDYVDLSSLGKVTKLGFSLSSSDNGDWGMNTPAYFCFDDFGAERPNVSGLTITADNKSRAYGEANPTLTYTTSVGTLSGTPALSCSAIKTSPVGSYDIVVSKGSVTNTDVTYVNGTLTVTKAPLTITVKSVSKKQGETMPTFELTYSGFKNGETDSVLTRKPIVTCEATVTSPQGTYPIIVSGAEAENYDITYVNGTLTVTASPAIQFADAAVKAICVKNWDTDGDGELTEEEAAAVTDLGNAFYRNDNITSFDELQFFTGLVTIGKEAFWLCSGLTSITIPNSVTSIEFEAFTMCSGLTSITIPNSVTSIGEGAFAACSGLKSITIPNSVTNISNGAFGRCNSLESIIVETGNTSYDSRNNCNAIIETAFNTLIAGCKNTIIPNSVISIGYEAFWGCSGLTSITIPNSVTSIGYGAFWNCDGLISITIPNSVTSIGERAFFDTALTSITIPNSVTSIGNEAFGCCNRLTSIIVEVDNKTYDSRSNCNAIIETKTNTLIIGCKGTTIPNSVTSIGELAFSCSDLTSITISNSVKSIGDYAFWCCNELTSVTSYITNPFALNENVFQKINSSCALNVPYGTKSLYEQTDGWHENFSEIVEMAPETLVNNNMTFYVSGQNATFIKASDQIEVIVPATVTSNDVSYSVTAIADSAFAGLSQLKSVKIPSSVKAAGKNLFVGSSHLAAITWEAPMKMTQEMAGSVTSNPNLLFYAANTAYAPDGVTNVINSQTKQADRIVLSDAGDGNDFYCPEEFTAKEIIYIHSYQQTTVTGKCQGWESLVLPFDVTGITHVTKGVITPFGALQIGHEFDNGTKPFWLYEYTTGGSFAEADGIKANVPYILSMPNEAIFSDEYILAGNITFKGSNATVKTTSGVNAVKSGNYSFTPNYENAESTSAYLLNVGQSYDGNPEGSVFVKGLRKARPFEAYFQLDSSAGVKGYFGVFDQLTDEIRSIEPAKRNGNAEYYQLDGTKRTSPQRGFNIIRTKEGKTHKVILRNSSGNFAEQ